MCGIIGILGRTDVAPAIVEGLKRLEYRGYDSAGVAAVHQGRLDRRRASGKLANLEAVLAERPLPGAAGIGHTRWATHGAPTETNAHPHATERVSVVHNGIIENFAVLRRELQEKGRRFESETDAEVCPQLITHYLETENLSPAQAFHKAISRLKGAFAFVAIFAGEDDLMIGARRGSPLAVGRGHGEIFIGSDAYALAPFSNRVTYLDEGDWVVATRAGFQVYDAAGAPVVRKETISSAADALVDKDGHRHFMAKEIHEQPEVIAHTLSRYLDPASETMRLPEGAFDFARLDRLTVSACGTAYYAGLISKYWFETWAGLPVEIDIASELRYRDVPYTEGGGALFVSQSGETADTLAALREARARGQKIAAVVNVPESSIAREADVIFPMAAGPEIGVASTKAFTCQLAALACIAVAAGRARGRLDAEAERALVRALLETPRLVAEALAGAGEIEAIAREIAEARDVLYVGRGVNFPLALEGALKLKEISYIHAEGYAAGELKHGPIALIDKDVPVIVVAPRDALYEKTISNMHEVMARGGKALLISDREGIAEAGDGLWRAIETPTVHPLLAPVVYAAPIQLLAYYTATAKGTDVDQPRNLAKSVTVE
ncbi:glutamine--fructose-6-phosphate transaminase (isomerizing) [Amphiplicatus metriothermophilus]|uniref:Glutamine--fructose-6-phosphate aminotransferase [isomerizing] n=1 Tax=Amphiplicatus metriothermophilus TaxID=1519374 RepID=A0A239PXP8_9PROT|nr:glutamine--fructose-6-phosphate transaminase (isomerizing) [Amphiplicatus metriothermophilus]MBB5519900.1 glucosamine--fructose-6-phosphate aminotransferase (isomerizing) [Amphiplicatus metriothermophilus]SNT74803.1 glucosamine--fructose-6-phosphate aminotransferase (isomerizing) [Amphiplicatus metriothermophilus]